MVRISARCNCKPLAKVVDRGQLRSWVDRAARGCRNDVRSTAIVLHYPSGYSKHVRVSADEQTVSMGRRFPPGEEVVKEVITSPSLG